MKLKTLSEIRNQRKKNHWKELEILVEKKILLSTDIAYAETVNPDQSTQEAALLCALLFVAREGHLCLCKELLPSLPEPLRALLPKEERFTTPFSLPKYQKIEEKIAHHVKHLIQRSLPPKAYHIPPSSLTEEQLFALKMVASSSFCILTGGPGTGKTFTAAAIAKSLGIPVVVAAPTGKAANHLLQNFPSSTRGGTLHSILRIGQEAYFTPPLITEPLVIVDECSMLDPFLFEKLLSAIGANTTLLLMGDPYQLSAVEGGSLFADLIPFVPHAVLTKCMRSDKKAILDIADKILKGEKGACWPTLDFGFKEGDQRNIYQNLLSYGKTYFPKDWKSSLNACRILTPLRIGPYGTDALNRFFFDELGADADQVPIMITKNDLNTALSNGELGVLFPQEKRAFFPGKGSLSSKELPSFEYAYCISVHKSQGSEYDRVLLLLPPGSEGFGKEILYTGVTRAKETLDIAGDLDQIALALNTSSRKYSSLAKGLIIS